MLLLVDNMLMQLYFHFIKEITPFLNFFSKKVSEMAYQIYIMYGGKVKKGETMYRVIKHYDAQDSDGKYLKYDDGAAAALQQGIQQGTQQKAIEAAKNCLKEGDSPEKVSRCIGLPLEKVLELQKNYPRRSLVYSSNTKPLPLTFHFL